MQTSRHRTRYHPDESEVYTYSNDRGILNGNYTGNPYGPLSASKGPVVAGTYRFKQVLEEMHDTSNPEFEKRSALGEIVLSDMTQSRVETTDYGVNFVTRSYTETNDLAGHGGFWHVGTLPASKYITNGNIGWVQFRDVPSFAEYAGKARLLAEGNIDDARASLLVTAAEMRKTLNVVQDTVGAVEQLHTAFSAKCRKHGFDPKWSDKRKNRWKKKKGVKKAAVKAVSNAWLTYRYGVRPLLFDVKSILEAYATKPNLRFTARGTSEATLSLEKEEPFRGRGSMWSDQKVTRSLNDKYTYGIICEIPNPLWGKVQHWGLDDIAETIWELIPYSFVFDWFSALNKVIDGFTIPLGVVIKGQWLVRERHVLDKVVLKIVQSQSHYSYNSYYRECSGGGQVIQETTAKTRWTDPTDMPPSSVNQGAKLLVLNEKTRLDAAKVLDLIALVTSRM